MNNLLSQKTLVGALLCLLALKFVVNPIFAWQSGMLAQLEAKKNHLSRMSSLVDGQQDNIAALGQLKANIDASRRNLYSESDNLELDIQRDVEEVFAVHGLVVTQFNWVSDSSATVRTLRAKINFRGTVRQMIGVFWSLAGQPKIINQVEWRQQITGGNREDPSIGLTLGHVVLEFYAMSGAPDSRIGFSEGVLDVK